jgi:hypothetical protein
MAGMKVLSESGADCNNKAKRYAAATTRKECNGGVTNGDSIGGCTGGGGSASDSGDQMDADARAKELARRKEEAKRKRRKKKRTGSSLVSSCFQGETCAKPASFQALPQFYFGSERSQLNLNVTVRKWQVSMLIALVR